MAGSLIDRATDFGSVGCRFESYPASYDPIIFNLRKCRIMVLPLPSKQKTRVRFPSLAFFGVYYGITNNVLPEYNNG